MTTQAPTFVKTSVFPIADPYDLATPFVKRVSPSNTHVKREIEIRQDLSF